MGLISKILHKDKHEHDEPADTTSSGSTTMSQNKSYYTGPHNDTSSTTGPDTTTNTPHGLGSNTATSGLPSSATTSAHTTTGNTTSGPHSSDAANKVDPRIDSDNSRYGAPTSTGPRGYGSNNQGPHPTNTGNALDPRIDSDNSRYDSTTSGRQHGIGSDNYGRGHEYSTTSGPHSSDVANKADPRIDSDNSRYTAGGVSGSHSNFADTASGGHHGYDSTPGGFPASDPRLDHSSGLSTQSHMNKDGYGSTTGTGNFSARDPYSSSSTNAHGPHGTSHAPSPYGTREDYGSTGPASHTLGPHSSNAANVVDPRVRPEPEKMRDHKTVGPHQSDMLNKLDPRVDSDPRAHGYSREPGHNDHHHYGSTDSGKQTGGFVGGPHERLENRGSIPTAGGLPVGADGNGPYESSHRGLPGSHERDHQYESSHGGLTGSHGRDPYESSHGGLTGLHGHDQYNSRSHEPYGAGSSGMGSGAGYGPSSHTGGGSRLADIEYKEKELALRQKELDLKEREYRINNGY